MTSPLHPAVPVTDDIELVERWTRLLAGDGPPSRRTLHLSWLRLDGTSVPLLVPVDDVPVEADRELVGNLTDFHATVAEGEGVPPAELHLALCLERRGPAGLVPDDLAWAAAVESVLRGRDGVDCSLHVGNGRWVAPLLPRESWPVS